MAGINLTVHLEYEDVAKRLKEEGWATPVRCKNCKFNYGLSAGHGFSQEDIVCDFWDSDGLDENDFCSHGEQFVKECD